jgi:ADP-ribosylation factor-binding protein GGA
MCEEESDDSEAVAKLLEINDSIHRTVERYKLVKKGDVEAAAKIPKGTLGTTTGVGKNAANELSLIDFEPEPTPNGDPNGTSSAQAQATSVQGDLLGLSMDDKPYGQSGGIALGFGTNTGIPGPALLSSTMQQNSARTNVPTNVAQVASTPQPTKPNYDPFSTFSSSRPASKPATPTPSMQQQKQTAPHATTNVDPFAALVSPSPRAGSPAHPRVTSNPAATSSSLLDLMDNSSAPSAPSNADKVREDEWNFASSLPEAESTQPVSHHLQVLSSYIKIDFLATRQAQDQTIHIIARFSNDTSQAISGLHFQVAVEKVCKHMKMN